MIDTDTIVDIRFSPDNPVSFYSVCHYDIDAALDLAFNKVCGVGV